MNVGAIASRAVGQYPLSIATSLALEGAMGIHPDNLTGKEVFLDYGVLWVNLKTIFRNFYNAIDRESRIYVKPRDLAQGILEELSNLERVVADLSTDRIQVQFYVCDYAGMDTKYRYATLRVDTTDLQRAYTGAMKMALSLALPVLGQKVKTFRLKITDVEHRPALLLTHYPYDLLVRNFTKHALLESHTGAVKEKHQWYTKYLNGNTLIRIPFREDLMQVFGDSEHFRPMAITSRKIILDLAEKYKWSQLTTTAKVRYGVDQIQDPYFRDIMKKILVD